MAFIPFQLHPFIYYGFILEENFNSKSHSGFHTFIYYGFIIKGISITNYIHTFIHLFQELQNLNLNSHILISFQTSIKYRNTKITCSKFHCVELTITFFSTFESKETLHLNLSTYNQFSYKYNGLILRF